MALGVEDRPLVFASTGHMIIQCGPDFTQSAPGAGLVAKGSVLLASVPPASMYMIPGALLPGFGARAIHAPAHFIPSASAHIGSGPGVPGLSGRQVQPLVPG